MYMSILHFWNMHCSVQSNIAVDQYLNSVVFLNKPPLCFINMMARVSVVERNCAKEM